MVFSMLFHCRVYVCDACGIEIHILESGQNTISSAAFSAMAWTEENTLLHVEGGVRVWFARCPTRGQRECCTKSAESMQGCDNAWLFRASCEGRRSVVQVVVETIFASILNDHCAASLSVSTLLGETLQTG